MKKDYTVQFKHPDSDHWRTCITGGKPERLTKAEAERLAAERTAIMGEFGYQYRAVERSKKDL